MRKRKGDALDELDGRRALQIWHQKLCTEEYAMGTHRVVRGGMKSGGKHQGEDAGERMRMGEEAAAAAVVAATALVVTSL